MNSPFSDRAELERLREEARLAGNEVAALLYQLHLTREAPDDDGLLLLWQLLPDDLWVPPHALSYARALRDLFGTVPLSDVTPYSHYTKDALTLIALLLREEGVRFSPESAQSLLGRINHYFYDLRGNENHCADLLLLYEIVQCWPDDARRITVLYERNLSACLDPLAALDFPSFTDLLMVVGKAYIRLGQDSAPSGIAMLNRCIALRQEHYPDGSLLLIVPRWHLMDGLRLLGRSDEALQMGASLLSQPETDENRSVLCYAFLLNADVHLDLLESAGVEEILDRAQALYDRLEPGEDEDQLLLFHLHTCLVRYYLLNTTGSSDLNRLEYHAQQAYLLSHQHDYGPENTLIAINNLLTPLSNASRAADASALFQEGLALIAQYGMEQSRSAAFLHTSAQMLGLESPDSGQTPFPPVGPGNGDPVLSFWHFFNQAWDLLQPRFCPRPKLAQAASLVSWCEQLLGSFCREVNAPSISLKRLRALLCLRQGDRDMARYWISSALENARANPQLHPLGMLFSFAISSLSLLTELLNGAELKGLLDELCASMPQRIQRILSHRDEEYILQALWSNTVVINLILSLSEQHLLSYGVEELYELILNGKSIYSRLLRINRNIRAENPGHEEVYRQIDDLRAQIMAEKTSEVLRGVSWDVSGLEQKKRLLELSLEEDLPGAFQWLSCRDVLRQLPEDGVFIDYYAYPANRTGDLVEGDLRYAVFVAHRSHGQLQLRRLPSLNFLQIRWYLLLLTAEARASRLRTLALGMGKIGQTVLYRLLFQPVAPLIQPHVRTIFLSPDGDLAKLPFGLLGPDADHRLCERYTFVYLESARDLKPDTVIHIQGREALVMGNPDFSLTPVDPDAVPPNLSKRLVTKIPLTKIEAQLVAEKTGAKPLLRRAASKGALQDCKASILHIATHGAFYTDGDEDSGLASLSSPLSRACLYFAGANDWLITGREDPELGNGVLTAEELCHYRMEPPELVVLSACFSGTGDMRQGNGIVGLQTAFKVLRAKVMLLSIWEANDFASAVLMDRFYDNLTQMPAAQALREAQAYLRTVTIAQLGDGQWFDERRFRRIGLVAEDMRRMSQNPPNFRPFSHIRYWGGYILYE
ncbi:CHAT domain-containing protein [Pseudoflavonifractor phocaeensis]|uniref:CHAT domain-containing protein n=1 Tax=Pseudoflavonifractor phocaeensis TaxID=1870988 RepID=UPI001959A0F8|nr:CHAT domain-containing protein [Pseudoflavonifractor phocaeensis]MBM6870827.1 CHAT domain-containing protein [Pseudoflavonifractor phocaeensis]MBM6938667.1 CHAT domain-containing protein [Pseudoflavonifractor phocaeensis]